MTCLLEAGPPSLQALAGIQTENSPALKQHKGPEVAGETTKYDPAWWVGKTNRLVFSKGLSDLRTLRGGFCYYSHAAFLWKVITAVIVLSFISRIVKVGIQPSRCTGVMFHCLIRALFQSISETELPLRAQWGKNRPVPSLQKPKTSAWYVWSIGLRIQVDRTRIRTHFMDSRVMRWQDKTWFKKKDTKWGKQMQRVLHETRNSVKHYLG